MSFINIFSDISILFVLLLFVSSLLYCFIKYIKVNSELKKIKNYLSDFKKSDLNFRFNEIDSWMQANPYVSSVWSEFRNTLVFSESVALKDGEELLYEDVSTTVQNIQTTVDPLYFFNEEILITSKFNNKIIQVMPTILTGCGPLFTFLKIAIAFGAIDFSTQEKTVESVAAFMMGMQSAALVSVIAVASSLTYLLSEKIFYNILCKSPLASIQNSISDLFASISSEKFLYELLRESKIQNNSASNLIGKLPVHFKDAFNESVITNMVPYLENIIYGINQLNKQLQEIKTSKAKQDSVDELF